MSGREVGARGLFALAALAAPPLADAHSFGRLYNLPVPFWLYVYGAAAALALSFVAAAWFVTAAPSAPEFRARELRWLRPRGRRRLRGGLRALSVGLLLLCIATGLFGADNPYRNFNMSFFWVAFGLGFTYLVALVGDVYAMLNPWRVLADGLARAFPAYTRARFQYPERAGYWPALGFYFAFIWIELFAHTRPFSLALMLLGYSVLNLLGAGLVGRDAWFRYCECFAVLLRLIAAMAPLDYAPGRGLRLRAPFAGLTQTHAERVSLLVFVLFMLASTAFDGLHDTVAWINLFWRDGYQLLKPWLGANPVAAYPKLRELFLVYETLGLLLAPALYLALYLGFIRLAKWAGGSAESVRALALRFAFSLLPIVLAYHLAHYATLLVTQGPSLVRLVSDPFGYGWNLFGTAEWLRAPILPDAALVWHAQVGLIVAGHIVSVVVAHLEALRAFSDRRRATLSQLPMLLLMVIFTTLGLWVLSQPIKAA